MCSFVNLLHHEFFQAQALDETETGRSHCTVHVIATKVERVFVLLLSLQIQCHYSQDFRGLALHVFPHLRTTPSRGKGRPGMTPATRCTKRHSASRCGLGPGGPATG